jgi:hypothetical protein
MLRTYCGRAGRSSIAIALLVVFHCAALRGGPLIGAKIGIPPVQPTVAPPPTTGYTISGYVYVDSALRGIKLPGEWGVPGVTLTLSAFLPSDLNTPLYSTQVVSNSAGYYNFDGLQTGNVYSILETQPAGYADSAPVNGYPPNSVGSFLSATGGSLAAPPGVTVGGVTIPSSGTQGSVANEFQYIWLPTATGAFAPSQGKLYSAINYNFGESILTSIVSSSSGAGIGKAPVTPSVPGTGNGTTGGTLQTNLAVVGGNNRFLAGAGDLSGNLSMSGTVRNLSVPTANWQITSLSAGLTLSPTSGKNLNKNQPETLTGSVNGTNLLPGTQNATFSILGTFNGSSGQTSKSTASAVINPVYSRGSDATSALQVSIADFGRAVQGSPASASFTVTSNGSHDRYSDLTMNAASVFTTDDNGSTFIGTNSSPFLFNGTNVTSPAVTVDGTFSSAVNGPVSGNVALPGDTGLFTGETLASGTPVLPSLPVSYSATVLEPRNLQPVTGGDESSAITVPTSGGGLLFGAVVPLPNAYTVTSTNANADDNHATRVIVQGSASGGTVGSVDASGNLVGIVAVTQTSTISSAGPQTVALSVQADNFGPTSGSAALSVVTGEAPSVNDTTAYAPVSVFYSINNVGYAATGGPDPANAKKQLFGAPLYASFDKGGYLAPSPGGSPPGNTTLTSLVGATGSSGSDSTTTGYDGSTLYYKEAVQQPLTASDVVGTVGSRCDILSSDALSNSTTVTMSWRGRNADEDASAFVLNAPSNWSTVLPAGAQWLTSDVVRIGGVPATSGTNVFAYAMQMSYDENINAFTESGGTSTVASSYLAKLDNSGVWTNAVNLDITTGIHAQTEVAESLDTFLNDNLAGYENANQYTLDELVGSWGVDLVNHQSWAIVDSGSGDFAVVPEPSTIALLGAAVGLLWYVLRRASRWRRA